MDIASCLAMKATRIILVAVLAVGVAYVLVDRLNPSAEAPVEWVVVEVEIFQPMEVAPPVLEPLVEIEAPCVVEVPETIEEPKTPVQPIEERGDAMLFESEALFGTPFDRAVVIPFN